MGRAVLLQERSRATRQAIMTAAEELWRTKGFDAVPVEDVCAKAGVAKGTFYFYFPRKEHLLVMLVRSRIAPPESELRSLLRSNLDTPDACMDMASAIARRVRRLDKPMVQRGVEESFRHYRDIGRLHDSDRALRWYFEPVFQRGKERGDVHPAWEMEALAGVAGWAMLQGILFWASGSVFGKDLAEHLRERVEVLAVGARVAPAERPLGVAAA
jgi:AcrR family transcriptional regulator